MLFSLADHESPSHYHQVNIDSFLRILSVERTQINHCISTTLNSRPLKHLFT